MPAYPKFDVKNLSSSSLFKPLKVGNLELSNRVVLAPLTRKRSPKHVPAGDAHIYYGQRAETPGTLLITEATFISKAAGGHDFAPGIYTDEQVEAWKPTFQAIRDNKSYSFVQLWALGRSAEPESLKKEGQDYVSASDVPRVEGGLRPRPLTHAEVKQYVADYVHAAKRSIEAGADGVELHSANGYLPDQFLHENTNKRTDEYGGSIENRARFTLEIIDALSEAIGAERVALRLSPWGKFGAVEPGVSPIPQFAYLASELEKRAQAGKRVAYIHIVEPRVHGNQDVGTDFATDLNLFFKQIWQGPIIRAGNLVPVIHDVANIDDRTLVGVGRYFISNPNLVQLLKDGRPLTQYDRSTFYWEGENWDIHNGYTDYPKDGEPKVTFDWTKAQG